MSKPQPYYSKRNHSFLAYEVLDVLQLTKHPYFSAHDRETMDAVLETAETIAEKIIRPAFVDSDRKAPELEDGNVKVHPALHDYYKAYCESGLMAAPFKNELGGLQLPETLYAIADFMLGNAHNGFFMFTGLSRSAAKLLVRYATPEIIEQYVPAILDGSYTATMCLTEAGAGSSLSDIVTEAEPQPDGTYLIKGQKIFISAGDHDITENIVHLVLARTKNAPAGVKGISLFVVPKKIKTNSEWIDNDVASVGLYHKMGQRSTPAMHLEFGGKNNCTGWLVGQEGKGLLYMFNMMNSARLGVGLGGVYIATAAYYASLQYAKERPQGRRANNKLLNEPPVTIIHHPDVRRMLLMQKAIVEGCLAFTLQCYLYTDLQKISEGEDLQRYTDLLELLTPVVKTCGSELGIVSVSNGLQVLGGYGYTEDFILEQLYRDVRIMSLYEGTTGIQAQALLGRQIPLNNARALLYWQQEVMATITEAKQFSSLETYVNWLLLELQQLEKVTKHLLMVAAKGDNEVFLSDANLYMELFGLINIGWQWLKQGAKAQQKLDENASTADDKLFYQSKLQAMKYFFHYELRKTKALAARLMDTEVLTIWQEDELIL